MDHNYSNSVRKQISRTKHQGSERVRQSAMTAIMDDTEKKFDFEADAYLIRKYQADYMQTAGANMGITGMQSAASSSEAGKAGKIYKFKNIHGDRGTNAGMSSQA